MAILVFAGWMILTSLDSTTHLTESAFKGQLRNIWNILTIKEPAENIGVYFYISIEIFKLHINFFFCSYLIYVAIVALQIRQLNERISEIVTEIGVKVEKRLFRFRCVIAFLILFMKVIFNQYPLIMDLHILLFALACVNQRFTAKYLEAPLFISWFILYTGCLSLIMWITWMHRFSGNVNFFYFQTFIFMLFFVVIFVQVFQGVNTKLSRYFV